MRYYEISSGFRVAMNAEQQAIIAKANKSKIRSDDLDEREQEVARLMVSRGLLNIDEDDNGIFYTPNSTADLWRF